MAFHIPIEGHDITIDGKDICLSIVGVKAFNLDNLGGTKSNYQNFKLGVGYNVKVCTNYCLFGTDVQSGIKVKSLEQLDESIDEIIEGVEVGGYDELLKELTKCNLTQTQFATLLGKLHIYNCLPNDSKQNIGKSTFTESHINIIANNYLSNEAFKKYDDGSVSLWNLYNHFTEAVKNSYINDFVDRNVNCYDLVDGLANAVKGEQNEYTWFLN